MLTVITNSLKLASQGKKVQVLLSIGLITYLSYENLSCSPCDNYDGCYYDTFVPPFSHSCLISEGGNLRCWGWNGYGQLGFYENERIIGDNETLASSKSINIDGKVVQVTQGAYHTCALLENGNVLCWGYNFNGLLGYGHDDDSRYHTPQEVAPIELGAKATQIAAGGFHTCALLENGRLLCWGWNQYGQLGYGHTDNIGLDQTPASVGYVDTGSEVAQVVAGFYHTCALLRAGNVRCWGSNAGSLNEDDEDNAYDDLPDSNLRLTVRLYPGELGYGHTDNIGDDETPASAGDIGLGGPARQIAAGVRHTCALLERGRVRCWGLNFNGSLGYDPAALGKHAAAGHTTEVIGDDESAAAVEAEIDIGGGVMTLSGGGSHTCALLEGGNLRCWGQNEYGQLGYGHRENIGDNERPASAGNINLGDQVQQVAAGDGYTCALSKRGQVYCWGNNENGLLGYGHTWDLGGMKPVDIGNLQVGSRVTQLWR